jgi:transposase-like protein
MAVERLKSCDNIVALSEELGVHRRLLYKWRDQLELIDDGEAPPENSAFCSWLRLCPEPKISGGQVLSSKTRPTKNRAALALRLAAQALHRSQTFLGDYFRRMKARLGPPKAITAVAHKLARIVYHMITRQQEYDTATFRSRSDEFRTGSVTGSARRHENWVFNWCP